MAYSKGIRFITIFHTFIEKALLYEKDFHLLNAVIQSDTEFKFGGNPNLQKHITQLFSAHGRLQKLLRYFFLKEIEETSKEI